MECPYCNHELYHRDSYGSSEELYSGNPKGYIYSCPNHEGFPTDAESLDYLLKELLTLNDLGISELNEITCGSSSHHVSGSFYTDRRGELYNGYPC